MARLGLEVRYPKKLKVTTDSDHQHSISPKKQKREFEVAEPKKVWATKITKARHMRAGSKVTRNK